MTAIRLRRHVVIPTFVLLGCALLAGVYFIGPRAARTLWTALELDAETVQLDGYALSVWDDGAGKPTLVIEPGLACSKNLYKRLHYDLSKKTRVITYDHAGIGDSTPSDNPRRLPYYVEELRALLARKGAEPPYILLGHSLGGHIIRYYAHLHPDEVAGLVFVDHPHEDWFEHIRQTWPEAEAEAYFEWWTPEGSTYTGTALDELLQYEHNCDLVRGILPPPDIPVLMFTGSNEQHYQPGELERDRRKWTDLQASLIREVEDAKHIVDWEASHLLHRDRPEMVAREIGAFIDRVRAKREARR